MKDFNHIPILEGNVLNYGGEPRLVKESGILITEDPREMEAKLTLAQLIGLLPQGYVINRECPTLLADGGVSDGPKLGEIVDGDTVEPHLVYATETRIQGAVPRTGELSNIHTVPLSQIVDYTKLDLPDSYSH